MNKDYLEFLQKKLTSAKKYADALGLTLQEYLLLVNYVNVDSIADKLDHLEVTSYPAYQG